MNQKIAVFGGGCFWGVEKAFYSIDGIIETEVGYANGTSSDVTYEKVCRGGTGHTEVARIVYDTEIISYESLLEIFWQCHNPTHANRQGFDIGWQYRSVIFYGDDKQRLMAEKSRKAIQSAYQDPIMTSIEPLKLYVRAEKYHQKYYQKHPELAAFK